MPVPTGLARRLAKLKCDDVFSILALDHGLTSGSVDGLEDISRWSKFADSSGIAALVLNIGALRRLPAQRDHAVVLQTVGSPSILGRKGSRRVPNSFVEEAVYFDADAISVQIDFTSPDVEKSVSEIASLRVEAHRFGLPVLFMVMTPKGGFDTGRDIVDAVKVANELGADLIKTSCEAKSSEQEPLLTGLRDIAPVVMAGGEAGEAFFESLGQARRLGFAGFCIGRNIFQSGDPKSVLTRIKAAFA